MTSGSRYTQEQREERRSMNETKAAGTAGLEYFAA
jgi:hypothetical protein